jgi:hypothetical protein
MEERVDWLRDVAAGLGLALFMASSFVLTAAAHALMAG